MTEKMIIITDQLDNYDLGNYGEYLSDYESGYTSDVIAEIADGHTSIYYSDILDFIKENPESLADVIYDGLYDPTHSYNLYQHGQAAEFMLIERDLYDHIADALTVCALTYARKKGLDELPESVVDDIETAAADADRVEEVIDIVDCYIVDQEEG